MKKVWIAKACPIAAAISTAPLPNTGIYLCPAGAVATNHTKKMQYPIILTIPNARRVAPKWKNFITNTIIKRTIPLMIGLITEYASKPFHWITIN